MPAPKGRYPPARYHQVPEHAEPLRMSQCLMPRSSPLDRHRDQRKLWHSGLTWLLLLPDRASASFYDDCGGRGEVSQPPDLGVFRQNKRS
jgi:hypothetical protein